ncbi:MAG TPA: hypothetical protein VMU78_07055 [Methylocella sp.]|nr:hypothetical protein [Methylocella sp.]
MDAIDVLVFVIVLATGVFLIPPRYDPQRLFRHGRRRLGELTTGLVKRDFGRVIDPTRVVHED